MLYDIHNKKTLQGSINNTDKAYFHMISEKAVRLIARINKMMHLYSIICTLLVYVVELVISRVTSTLTDCSHPILPLLVMVPFVSFGVSAARP